MKTLKIYKQHPDALIPTYGTGGAACFDLYALLGQETQIIKPGETVLIETGLIFDIPKGYCVKLYSRSGLALKQGLVLANGIGIIDYDYTNPVKVMLHNQSSEEVTISNKMRIAQGEMVQYHRIKFEETAYPPSSTKSDRTGGFGSTGIS